MELKVRVGLRSRGPARNRVAPNVRKVRRWRACCQPADGLSLGIQCGDGRGAGVVARRIQRVGCPADVDKGLLSPASAVCVVAPDVAIAVNRQGKGGGGIPAVVRHVEAGGRRPARVEPTLVPPEGDLIDGSQAAVVHGARIERAAAGEQAIYFRHRPGRATGVVINVVIAAAGLQALHHDGPARGDASRPGFGIAVGRTDVNKDGAGPGGLPERASDATMRTDKLRWNMFCASFERTVKLCLSKPRRVHPAANRTNPERKSRGAALGWHRDNTGTPIPVARVRKRTIYGPFMLGAPFPGVRRPARSQLVAVRAAT